jgi:hypothetical protein
VTELGLAANGQRMSPTTTGGVGATSSVALAAVAVTSWGATAPGRGTGGALAAPSMAVIALAICRLLKQSWSAYA